LEIVEMLSGLLNSGVCARARTYQCETISYTHMRQLSVGLFYSVWAIQYHLLSFVWFS